MRIAISGSRTFEDFHLVGDVVEELIFRHGHWINVGDAKAGVDLFVRQWLADFDAEYVHVGHEVFVADWERFGKRAGHIRNEAMLAKSDGLIAIFANGPRSPGTSNAVATAARLGLPHRIWHEGRWTWKPALTEVR